MCVAYEIAKYETTIVMSCGFCGKRGKAIQKPYDGVDESVSNAEWGPFLWKTLHCIAEKVGRTGPSIEIDQKNDFEFLILNMGNILPCKICQKHYRDYLKDHTPDWKKLKGMSFHNEVVNWLFVLHNKVRSHSEQSIDIDTVEKCSALYKDCKISSIEMNRFNSIMSHATRMRIVKHDTLSRWMSIFNRLIILTSD